MLSQKKTNTPTELWQVTQKWLQLLGNKPNTKYCKEEIATHPDYPAMTAVTDFLDAGNMPFVAAEADATYYNQFTYPLLAHIKQPGQEHLQIINSITDWQTQKQTTQFWSGIVLFANQNTQWKNAQNDAYNTSATKNNFIVAALTVLLIIIFTTLSIQHFNALPVTFGLLSLLGLVISLFAFGVELGYQNQIVKQVCGAVSSGGCQTVLKSKFAKGVFGITPADASLVYFAAQFILYLLSTYFTNYFFAVTQISILGIVIAALSIYTQAIKLKQWCALCLGIVVVLLLQTAIGVGTLSLQFYILNYGVFIIACAILYAILYPIKQLIKTNTTNQQTLAEFKKWKTDATLFTTQWQQEQQIDTTEWENDLVIGNPNALILITVACNPYCGPCATTHKQLDELLEKHPTKLKVQIRLLCRPEIENDKLTKAVIPILQKATTIKDNAALQQMLTDWFEWMNLEKWEQKWKPNKELEVNEALQKHTNWIKKSNIQFTPTLFINGKKLPSRYTLKDVEILLPQLTQILT